MENESKSDVAETDLETMRTLLVRDEQLPLGLVSRLEAGVVRDRTARAPVGWEVRLAVACVCFAAFGLWTQVVMSALLTVALALIALLYPWATHGPRSRMEARRPRRANPSGGPVERSDRMAPIAPPRRRVLPRIM
jgi:Flp pilus assembly protein TadB